MSIITTVADAIVTSLTGASLTGDPDIKRVWKIPRSRVDSKKPKVFVLPSDYSRTVATRSKSEKDIGIDVVVHQLVGDSGTSTTESDAVMGLVDEVHEALEFGQFGGYTLYTFELEEAFNLELLQTSNIFATLTTCRLKGVT